MEDINLIPRDEVSDVAVQLVTYNGNKESAYGSLRVDFDFNNGEQTESEGIRVVFDVTGTR